MLENERAMYTGAAMAQRTEVALQWQRNGFFLLINLALVTVLGGFLQRGDVPAFIPIAMAIAGTATGFLWWLANSHTNDWILYWESCLRAIELWFVVLTVGVWKALI